ncbi:uncharacterized protein LOC131948883 [Physella acuta]|uniref:uncharacterized protein LOC131948883 n=1 Tax=Physella acuta TaxID=109671 RepID=UPI0027DE0C10|nr:uncharacterized protein LOC131948883 [Physella acuta]XP_059166576.1 uncharacterized protein LOC131948883 [Physella acuta]XP_059166577.1 uncharacterized protein LOC131948883 [Physella acuta]
MHLNVLSAVATVFLMSSVAVSSAADATLYPPDQPPVVVVYNKIVKEGETIQLNTSRSSVAIECTVEGGNPKVSNITMACDGNTFTINKYSEVFNLTYTSSVRSIPCTCSAKHVTGLYKKTTSFTFSTGHTAVLWNVILLTSLLLGRTVLSLASN